MTFPQTFLVDNAKCIAYRDVIQDRKFGLFSELGWWHHNHELELLKNSKSPQIETSLEYVRQDITNIEHNDPIITLIKSNA